MSPKYPNICPLRRKFKQFYLTFKDLQIPPTVSAESTPLLSWSHYERLLRVKDSNVRKWYEEEATKQMWSCRTLDRNINTLYYHRMLSSQAKDIVEQEMQNKTSEFQNDRLSFIKNPAVLGFLGLPENKSYTESDLEQAIIDQMQNFLLELGKGFSFVAWQQLIRTDTAEFYIDLVFYNYLLNCFVIIELKNHAITHQDIGQLDMYVRLYDDLKKDKKIPIKNIKHAKVLIIVVKIYLNVEFIDVPINYYNTKNRPDSIIKAVLSS